MLTQDQIDNLPGTDVYGRDGARVGRAGTVYIDDQKGRPEWATVHTGLFGMRESFLPLSRAEIRDDSLTVPYSKDQVKDAPTMDPEGGHLSLQEERRLYHHYGLEPSGPDTAGGQNDRVRRNPSDVETGDAPTRFEEPMNMGSRRDETGPARLRKYMVTDQRTDANPNRLASLSEPDGFADGVDERDNP